MKVNVCALIASMLVAPFSLAIDWQAEWQLCSSVANDQQRLACFDGIAQRNQQPSSALSSQAGEASAPVSVAAAQTVTSLEQNFGLEQQIIEQQTKEIDEISAQVVSVKKDPYGKLTIVLDNQQRWKLQEKGLRLKVEDSIIISRGALGSFYVNKANQSRKIRVKRLD